MNLGLTCISEILKDRNKEKMPYMKIAILNLQVKNTSANGRMK